MRTQPIPTLATAGLLAMLALPGTARAATMGTIPIDPTKDVSGTFDAPGTQQWRLVLDRGKDYVVSGTGDCGFAVSVRAPGGRTVGSFGMDPDNTDGPEGTSFRAAAGWYVVAVTATPADFADGNCAPGDGYGLQAARDCPGDASTRCAIATGATLRGLRLDSQEDADWFRATLQAGRAYTLTETSAWFGCVDLAIRDAHGRIVAENQCETRQPQSVAFTAPVSGIYYASVATYDPPTPYSLVLTTGSPGARH